MNAKYYEGHHYILEKEVLLNCMNNMKEVVKEKKVSFKKRTTCPNQVNRKVYRLCQNTNWVYE